MKLALTASITLVVLASAMFGVGTLAYFIDVEESLGNTIIDGTFDIIINGNSLPFKAWNIMPGWSEFELHGVQNIGSVSGKVYITAENFVDSGTCYGGTYAEPQEPEQSTEVSPENFAMILFMRIYADENHDHIYESGEIIYDGPVYGMETALFDLDPTEYTECKFVAYLPTDLDDPTTVANEDDNLYQADGVAFDIVFHGTTKITIG